MVCGHETAAPGETVLELLKEMFLLSEERCFGNSSVLSLSVEWIAGIVLQSLGITVGGKELKNLCTFERINLINMFLFF